MKKGKLKQQHVKLYNAVWEALHAEDKFVVTSKLCHEELVAYLADVMQSYAYDHPIATGWHNIAEAVIRALQLSENQDEFTKAQRDGQAEFEAECAEEFISPLDHEADFQEFMAAYDMPTRLTRLMRLAYLCGVADEHVPEM